MTKVNMDIYQNKYNIPLSLPIEFKELSLEDMGSYFSKVRDIHDKINDGELLDKEEIRIRIEAELFNISRIKKNLPSKNEKSNSQQRNR